jgi:hypothetical protein
VFRWSHQFIAPAAAAFRASAIERLLA